MSWPHPMHPQRKGVCANGVSVSVIRSGVKAIFLSVLSFYKAQGVNVIFPIQFDFPCN